MGGPTSSAATVATTPTLAGVTIVTPSINTSANASEVAIRVHLVASPKANVTDIRLTFYRHPSADVKANIVVLAASVPIQANARKECTSTNHAKSPVDGDTTMCLYSGTVSNGYFELRTLLPRWSTNGTYFLDRVEVRDSLAKRLDLDYVTLATRYPSARFNQSGLGDDVAPALVSTTMLTPTVNSAQQNAIASMRVHATDDLSGIFLLSARFRHTTVVNGVTQYLAPEIVTSAYAGRACPAPSSIPALVGQYGYVCREAGGTALDGSYLVYFLVPRWSAQGTYQLTNVSLVDAAKNRLDDIAADLNLANASATFTQTGTGDTSGPIVSGITVLTPTVKVKAGTFDTAIKVSARDAVSGIKQMWIDYKSAAKPTAGIVTFSTTDVLCSVKTAVNHCRYSGTALNGVWRMHTFVAAASPKGKWNIWRVRIQDNAGNLQTYSGTALITAHLTSSFTLA
jgi:hypothetical protein